MDKTSLLFVILILISFSGCLNREDQRPYSAELSNGSFQPGSSSTDSGTTVARTSTSVQGEVTVRHPDNQTAAKAQPPESRVAAGQQSSRISLAAKNIAFNKSTITVPAGANVTINFDNQDDGVPHNFAVYETEAAQKPIFQGKIITGPAKIAYTFKAPDKPGTYFFRCDVHPSMNGRFIAVSQGAFTSKAGSEMQASQPAVPIGAPSIPMMAEMNKQAADKGYAVLVEISRYTYSPDSITVPAGTTVTWRNLDPVPHTVTSAEGKFDSGIIESGKNFSYIFKDPGTYAYYCTIHPYMRARIIVVPSAGLQIAATGLNQTESNPSPISLAEPESVGTTIGPISTTSPQPSTRVVVDLLAKDMRFDKDKITVIAGSRVFINFINLDVGVPHNFAVYTGSEAINSIFQGQVVIGPSKITYSFNAPVDSGKYFFRCDVHPKVMTGDIYVVSYEDLEPPQADAASQGLSEMSMLDTGKSVTMDLVAENIAFDKKTITVPAGTKVTVNFNNRDSGVPHNFAVYETAAAEKAIFIGQIVTGPARIKYTFDVPTKPGTYVFRCDVHPTQMTGQFIVEPANAVQ
jgi:plastocyanin